MNKRTISDEDRWRAETDAEALIRAYGVRKDDARFKLAKEAMQKRIKGEEEELKVKKNILKSK